jgi:hypothetical protein
MTAVQAEARDYLAELRALDDDAAFGNLAVEVAAVAPELENEVCELAGEFGPEFQSWIWDIFAEKRKAREAAERVPIHEGPAAPLPVAKPAPRFVRRIGGEYSGPKKISPTVQPKTETKDTTTELDTAIKAQSAPESKPEPAFKFHPSDWAKSKPPPPTIEEKNRALEKLAVLWDTDPLAYAEQRRELADQLCTTVAAIDKAAKLVRDQQDDEKSEPNQTTKLSSICVSDDVRLWHSRGVGYASVRVGEHWENYKLGGTGFEEWLLY